MTKIKKLVRRNERKWTTKKAKKASLSILSAILFMLTVETIEHGLQTKTILLEGQSLSSLGVSESQYLKAESAEASPEHTNDNAGHDIAVKDDIQQLIKSTFPEDPETAVAVAKAESGLKADNVGDGHIMFLKDGKPMGMSCGLFQIRVLEGRPDCESLKDVQTNLKWARKLYEKSGWQPWSAYKNNSYMKHL